MKEFRFEKITFLRSLDEELTKLLSSDKKIPGPAYSNLYIMSIEDRRILQDKCRKILDLYDQYYSKVHNFQYQIEEHNELIKIAHIKKLKGGNIVFREEHNNESQNNYSVKHWTQYRNNCANNIAAILEKTGKNLTTFDSFVDYLNALCEDIATSVDTGKITPEKGFFSRMLAKTQSLILSYYHAVISWFKGFISHSTKKERLPEELVDLLDSLSAAEQRIKEKKTSPCISFMLAIETCEGKSGEDFRNYQKFNLSLSSDYFLDEMACEFDLYNTCAYAACLILTNYDIKKDYPQHYSKISSYENYFNYTQGNMCFDMMVDKMGPQKGWLYGYSAPVLNRNAMSLLQITEKPSYEQSVAASYTYLSMLATDLAEEKKCRQSLK